MVCASPWGNKQKQIALDTLFPTNLPSDPQAALSQLSQRNRPLQTEHTPAAQHQLLHTAASSGSPTPPPSAAAPHSAPAPRLHPSVLKIPQGRRPPWAAEAPWQPLPARHFPAARLEREPCAHGNTAATAGRRGRKRRRRRAQRLRLLVQ